MTEKKRIITSRQELNLDDQNKDRWIDTNRKSKINSITEILYFYSDKELVKLKILKLGNSQISRIEGLERTPNLTELWLNECNIQEIKNLSVLKKLKYLYLDGNKIQKIEGLNLLENLEGLALESNEISKIENLQGLKKLKFLRLHNNPIKKFEDLDTLYSLEYLSIYNTNIEEITKLENLKSLKTCIFITIRTKIKQITNFSYNFLKTMQEPDKLLIQKIEEGGIKIV